MPKTPSQQEDSSNRFNPYITKSISKSLLTPCRRVGLSRKKTTPTNINTTPNETNNAAINLPNLDSTSVNSRSIEIVGKCSEESTPILENVKPKRKKVAKCLIDSDSDDEVKLSALKPNKLEDVEPEVSSLNDCKTDAKAKRSKQKDTSKNLKSRHEKHNVTHQNDEKPKELKVNATPKKVRDNNENEVQMELKLNPNDDVISDEKTDTKSALQEINDNKIEMDLDVQKNEPKPLRTYEGKKSKKLKRSLSLKKSPSTHTDYDEFDAMILKECSIDLTPIDSKEIILEPPLPSDLVSEMNCLEKQIQDKRKLVDDLRQAEIYKNLHDVDKLDQLTAQWKSGCISGLNDLLPHLQQQSNNMDMSTLLTTLQIPNNLISLSESGDLI